LSKEMTLDSFLTSFKGGERDKKAERREVEVGVEEEVRSFITSRGRVPKSDLYAYAKRRGIKPVDLYKALKTLEDKGVIRKAFDGELKELIYIVK